MKANQVNPPMISEHGGRRNNTQTSDQSAAKRASLKLEEGDVKGAVRALLSEDKIILPSNDTLQVLAQKHPPCPPDRRRILPVQSIPPLRASESDISEALKHFPPGSAGGPDGLKPQHLREMADGPSGHNFIACLTLFVNMILSGNSPAVIRSYLFGGTLLGFQKKDGGVRPIAIGYTIRRLAAKVAVHRVAAKCGSIMGHRQLGFGVAGGAEAAAHAVRCFLSNLSPNEVFVKLDFTNAFNSIRRDCVLEAVARFVPELMAFVSSAYAETSVLSFGEFLVESAEGVQQGDPLGPWSVVVLSLPP